ncbi:unnamed protein product [Lampetra fluviatilis]
MGQRRRTATWHGESHHFNLRRCVVVVVIPTVIKALRACSGIVPSFRVQLSGDFGPYVMSVGAMCRRFAWRATTKLFQPRSGTVTGVAPSATEIERRRSSPNAKSETPGTTLNDARHKSSL